jgi:hypothetical protein
MTQVTTATLAVQTAIYATLAADGPLTALAGIYDEPPQGAAFPYVTIGEATEVPWDTFGRQGRELVCTLHVWSRAKGFTEAATILQNVLRLLDRAALTVANYTAVRCVYEFGQPMRDPDGITRHIVARFRVSVEGN